MAFPSSFIRTISTLTTGALGALPRSIVLVTRESITSSYTPDPLTGLISITASNYEAFYDDNISGAPGVAVDVKNEFAGSVAPNTLYVLSTGGVAVTSNMLTLANSNPRLWSVISLSSQSRGIDDTSAFFTDAATINSWCTDAREKLFIFTASIDADDDTPELPAQLGAAQPLRAAAPNTLTCVSNAYEDIDEYTRVYNNPILAVMVFVLYGGYVSRSAGSLSDAHDVPGALGDTFSQTFRNTIEENSLSQYNGAKDAGGSLFLYNTQMNDDVYEPTTPQIETKIAQYYTADYMRVYVRNKLQAAGQPGVVANYRDLIKIFAVFNAGLNDCNRVGAIQTNAQGQPDFVAILKSEADVDALDPSWRNTGKYPVGAISAQIRYYAAGHYLPLVLQGV